LRVEFSTKSEVGFAGLLKVEFIFRLQLFDFGFVRLGVDFSEARVDPASFAVFHFWRSMQAIKPAVAVMMQMIGKAKSMVSLSR
jgi:hypothetical protein